ncbi:MGMT family protein [Bernardetia sp. OM2101]|uniref:MGMT family protein n=1 Tax=Bernardetia sp. OM2101 TaxID=3344876 RepID=UPI0035CFE1B9
MEVGSETLKTAKAIRIVASANGICHRVIGKDGKLTAYEGELERKKMTFYKEINKKGLRFFYCTLPFFKLKNSFIFSI